MYYRELGFLGFPGYRVGMDGSVWTAWKKIGLGRGKGSRFVIGEGWKEIGTMNNGYPTANLCAGRKMTPWRIHQLVLLAFVGTCPEGMEVCHNDGSKTNNCLENLRYGTRKENIWDKDRHGTILFGERNPMSKVTQEQVVDMRRRHENGESQTKIAVDFGIDRSEVSRIVNFKVWRDR